MILKSIKNIGALFLVLLFVATGAYAKSIAGTWTTIDDETKKAKSKIHIWVTKGVAYGKIIKLFREPGEEPDPVCTKCKGNYKGKKIVGMVNIWGLKEEDGEWTNGKILDPKNGKVYRAKLWREGNTLKVRGYLGPFYRTQTWKK